MQPDQGRIKNESPHRTSEETAHPRRHEFDEAKVFYLAQHFNSRLLIFGTFRSKLNLSGFLDLESCPYFCFII